MKFAKYISAYYDITIGYVRAYWTPANTRQHWPCDTEKEATELYHELENGDLNKV